VTLHIFNESQNTDLLPSSEKENYMLTYQLERCAVMQYSTK